LVYSKEPDSSRGWLFNSLNKTLLLDQGPHTPRPLWRSSPRGRHGLRVPSLTLRNVLCTLSLQAETEHHHPSNGEGFVVNRMEYNLPLLRDSPKS
jgi:hypothetical protein